MSIVPIYREGARHPQAQACAACEVRGAALFGVLDHDALDSIHTHIGQLDFAADQAVYGRAERGTAIYTIRSGVVRYERSTERGDRRIVRLAGRGDLIGQEALLLRPYADDAIACTAVQLCRIPRTLVDELAGQGAPLDRELMHRWHTALDDAEAWMADLATGPARRRLLRLLLKLSTLSEAGGPVWMPRRDEMGAMLDMTVETASRLVSQLRREGVIAAGSAREMRLDPMALSKAIREVDAS